jgi:hypothetical protein
VLRCDALEKEVTLSCTRYWPKMAPFFQLVALRWLRWHISNFKIL